LIDLPPTVQFDLGDATFLLQLQRLAILFPELFNEFSEALPNYVGMPWDAFEAITLPQLFEAAFDGLYLVLRLHFLHGELHIAALLAEGILKLVNITRPVIHVDPM
jgi:hypothetical protein